MTRLPIVRTLSAEQDITSILLYIFEDSPISALAMQDSIDATIRQLADNPWIGEAYKHATIEGFRRILVTHYPNYSIYYQVADSQLTIVRVIHNSRDLDSTLATPPD